MKVALLLSLCVCILFSFSACQQRPQNPSDMIPVSSTDTPDNTQSPELTLSNMTSPSVMPSDLEASPADDIPITEEDEKIAREVAMEYYSTIIINDRLPHVEKLVRIENFEEYEDYIPEGREKELVIAFYVTITSLEPKRNIILMRSREGIWGVVNEGY